MTVKNSRPVPLCDNITSWSTSTCIILYLLNNYYLGILSIHVQASIHDVFLTLVYEHGISQKSELK
jgi:hypothetical protein